MSIQFAQRAAGACAVWAAVLVVAPAGASAATRIATTSCSAPTLTEPFASFGETSQYALAPGEANDNFSGSGWTLSGGAKIVTATLYNGAKGDVLQLPSGAKAVSPTMCVTNAYSSARAMIKDVAGSTGVAVSTKYSANANGSGNDSVSTGAFTASGSAWSASSPLSITPLPGSGWQYATFRLTAVGTGSEYQIYNLYVDPKMRM